jgi:hypothetical protein
MPPVPDPVSILLRSSPTAAMAALLLISTSHRDLFAWASQAICGAAPVELKLQFKANGAARRGRHRKLRNNGGEPYLDPRREARDRSDEALLAAMRSNSEGSIGDWAQTIHKSRTSTVSALHRLRDAGLAESAEGKWRLAEPPAPREPPERWIAPLSAAQRAHAAT